MDKETSSNGKDADISSSLVEESNLNKINIDPAIQSLPNDRTLDLHPEKISRSASLNPQSLMDKPSENPGHSEECMFPWFSDSTQDLQEVNTNSHLGSVQSVNAPSKKKIIKKPTKNFSFSHNGEASNYRPSYVSQNSTSSFGHWGLQRGSRKNSVLSMTSQDIVGYLFGSAASASPSRKTSRMNLVTDSIGIYPSLMSLHSTDFLPSSFIDNELNDLKNDENEPSSRKDSLLTRISLDENDSAEGQAHQSAPIPIPTKKRGFQPMPDVVELPENETLTAHGAARQKLAMAAQAFAKTSGLPSKDQLKKDDDAVLNPKKYFKNLLVLCLSFFFVFTAYLALRNLQSSLNDSGGLGLYSLSCVYSFLFIGAMFTTTIVQRLRPKLSMLISLIGFIIYNSVNFYPSFITLIPASCIAGFCVAIIWTSHATYMTNNASCYAEATQQKFSDVLSRFHGIFFASFQLSQIVGGMISSVLFAIPIKSTITNNNQTLYTVNDFMNSTQSSFFTDNFNQTNSNPFVTEFIGNETFNLTSLNGKDLMNQYLHCAVNYCPGNILSSSKSSISLSVIYLMMGIFLACTLLGTFLLFFLLDPLEGPLQQQKKSILTQVFGAFRFYGSLRVLCLLPLMSYSLLQTTFFFGEFAKAHVTCVLGLHMLGYIMVVLSLVSGTVAFVTGIIQKYTGPRILILFALSLHVSLLVMMLFWHPTQDSLAKFFLIAILWGAGDGIITTQLISLIGVLFTKSKEAAFSGYKMTQALSAFGMFVTGPYVCTRIKIYTLIIMGTLAFSGFIILQLRLTARKRKKKKVPTATLR